MPAVPCSAAPCVLHPRVVKEWPLVAAEPFSIVFEKSCLSGGAPRDWKKANIAAMSKEGSKEDLRNSRPANLTSVPGKVMEQILLDDTLRHMRGDQVTRDSQHSFARG